MSRFNGARVYIVMLFTTASEFFKSHIISANLLSNILFLFYLYM